MQDRQQGMSADRKAAVLEVFTLLDKVAGFSGGLHVPVKHHMADIYAAKLVCRRVKARFS